MPATSSTYFDQVILPYGVVFEGDLAFAAPDLATPEARTKPKASTYAKAKAKREMQKASKRANRT